MNNWKSYNKQICWRNLCQFVRIAIFQFVKQKCIASASSHTIDLASPVPFSQLTWNVQCERTCRNICKPTEWMQSFLCTTTSGWWYSLVISKREKKGCPKGILHKDKVNVIDSHMSQSMSSVLTAVPHQRVKNKLWKMKSHSRSHPPVQILPYCSHTLKNFNCTFMNHM